MHIDRNIRLLQFFNFCADFKMYAVVAVLYFQQLTGSFAVGMSVFSVATIASAVFEIPTGILSDRIGRKWTTGKRGHDPFFVFTSLVSCFITGHVPVFMRILDCGLVTVL